MRCTQFEEFMDIIIAIGSINAFFFAFLVLTKSRKEISDKILITWLVFFGINLLTGFCAVKNVFGNAIIPGVLAAILFVCHFPFLFLYTISLTRQKFSLNPKLLIHLIPVLLMTGSMIPFFRFNGPEQKDIAYGYGDGVYLVVLPMLVMIVSSAISLTATVKTIRKHKNAIKDTFSYTENINMNWVQSIVYQFIGLFLLIVVVFGLLSFRQLNIAITDYILYTGLVLIIFFIGYHGYKQRKVHYPDTGTQVPEPKTEIKSDLDQADKLMHSLLTVMDARKPFLDPGLTIYTLAQMMEIPAHQLSRLLNIHMNQSFFEFINRYRVNEFKSILNKKEFRHYSILAIALEAGFNSKASFNRIFKQITNSTPSEYRKKMSQ